MPAVIRRIITESKKNPGQTDEIEDVPCTYEAAEDAVGRGLDRRKNYAIIDGVVCESVQWTRPCSGCSCDGEYPCSCCKVRGGGCSECGYTGKRRESLWLPVDREWNGVKT